QVLQRVYLVRTGREREVVDRGLGGRPACHGEDRGDRGCEKGPANVRLLHFTLLGLGSSCGALAPSRTDASCRKRAAASPAAPRAQPSSPQLSTTISTSSARSPKEYSASMGRTRGSRYSAFLRPSPLRITRLGAKMLMSVLSDTP